MTPDWKPLALALACLGWLLLGSGCRLAQPEPEDKPLPQDELRLLLRGFNEDFSTEIQRLADRAMAVTEDPEARRSALVWKMRLIPLCRSFLEHPDAKVAFVDTWALCAQVQVLARTTTGGASPTFSDPEGRGVEAARALVQRIERIGRTFLTEAQMQETRGPILAFAQSREIGERFFAYYRTHQTEEKLGAFVTGLVARPLNALNPFSGVSETAVAIHEVSESADSFRDAVQQLPDVLRWQIELILHDVRHSPEVQGALASLDEAATNTTRVAELAERLPAELQRTLDEAQETVAELTPLLASAAAFMESFDAAGSTWIATLRTLEETVASFIPEEDPDAPPPEPQRRPFDILDYAATARELASTAAELHVLLEDVREVAAGAELRNVADSASDTARSTVDHVVLRIGQLLFALLAGALVVRVVWTRTGRPRLTPRSGSPGASR